MYKYTLLALLLTACGSIDGPDISVLELGDEAEELNMAFDGQNRAVCLIKDSTGLWVATAENPDKPEEFSAPGGHFHHGEPPEDVATREVKEETGLVVLTTQLISQTKTTYYFYCSAYGRAETQSQDAIVLHKTDLWGFQWL